MERQVCLASALSLLCALPLAAQNRASRENAASVFRSDARLEQKVSLSYRDTPLSVVLADLSKSTGTTLTARPTVADDKVTLLIKERPAAEVLASVGRHLDFQWFRNRSGYELTQDAAGQAREAALRERARTAQIARAAAQMDAVAAALGLTMAERQERRRQIEERLKALDLTPEERARLRIEQQAFADAERPGSAAAVAVFRGLNGVQAAQLRAGNEVRLSTGEGTLPARTADLIHQAMQAMVASGKVTAFGGPGGGMSPDQLPPAGAEASVRFTDSPRMQRLTRSGRPRRELQLEFTLNSLRSPVQAAGPEGRPARRTALPVFWSPSPLAAESAPGRQLADAALGKEVVLDLPKSKPLEASARPAMIFLGTSSAMPGRTPLSTVAEALRRASGLEVLSDSFVRGRLDSSRLTGKMTVAKVLDTLAEELDYSWEKEGNLIRLRDNVFFEDRPAEVPERVLAQFRRRTSTMGGAGLDDLAALAAALTDPQVRGMQEYWPWYIEDAAVKPPTGPGGIYGMRHHLRFWASLTPQQRQAVRAGNILPVTQMNARQRDAFVLALSSPRAGFIPNPAPALSRPPTADELNAGGFSLRATEMRQQSFSAVGPNGDRQAVITLSQGQNRSGPPPPIRTPDGGELQLAPQGPATLVDNFSFNYHLAGQETPARTESIHIPRPVRKP